MLCVCLRACAFLCVMCMCIWWCVSARYFLLRAFGLCVFVCCVVWVVFFSGECPPISLYYRYIGACVVCVSAVFVFSCVLTRCMCVVCQVSARACVCVCVRACSRCVCLRVLCGRVFLLLHVLAPCVRLCVVCVFLHLHNNNDNNDNNNR